MITFSIFASTDAHSFSSAPSLTWSEWFEALSTPCTKGKNQGLPLVGFYSLKNEKAPRCDDNIDLIYALALDYEETYGEVPTLDEFELPFEHLIYSTPSHTKEKPRFRVVVPLGDPILPKQIPLAFNELLEWVPKSGLDPSCADISRSFYVYSKVPNNFTQPKHVGHGLFFAPLLIDRDDFDKWQALKRVKINGISTGGRNDTLKAQACAAVGIGKTIIEAAHEINDYDNLHHNPPLFNDPSEPNFRDGNTPLKRAISFTKRVSKNIFGPEVTLNTSQTFKSPTIESIIIKEEEKERESIQELIQGSTSGTMPDSLIADAPPLLAELAEFIFDSSYFQNIPYALSSAISVLSMYRRTRFRCGTLYSNLYIGLVGETSTGKTSSMSTAEYIIGKLGLSDLCIASPFSASGLGRALERHNGEGFWFWDEFGNQLGASTSRNAQSHEKGMLGELNRMHSKAGLEYKMSAYANPKTEPIVLKKAYLTILSTGTTGEVQTLVTGGAVSSGFFPRWLLVSPKEASGHQLQAKRPDRLPSSLMAKFKRLEAIFPNWMDFNAEVNIGFSKEASEVVLGFKDEPKEHPDLWGKFMENSVKIALAICESNIITFEELIFGMKFVRYCCEFTEKLFIHQSATAHGLTLLRRENQTSFDQVLQIFKKYPTDWIVSEQIMEKVFISERTLRKHIQALMAEGIITEGAIPLTNTAGRPKKAYRSCR